MNTDKKIRFAVVGCGHIGKRHAEMITRDEKAELVALCDIRPKEELGVEAYPVPFAKNLEELLKIASDVDVINICVPNGLHAEMAIKAIEAGCGDRETDGLDFGGRRAGDLYLVALSETGLLRDAESLFPAFGLDQGDGGFRQVGTGLYGSA